MTSISTKFIILYLIMIPWDDKWIDEAHGLPRYYCGYLSEVGIISLLDIGKCTQGTVVIMSQTYLQFLRIPQNNASTDVCDFDRYNVLHEGMGKKLMGPNPFSPPVFAGIMENVTFALRSTGYRKICDRIFYMTEYSELLIFETSKKSSSVTKRKTPTDHIDIFMYVNEKFVYPNVILEDIALQMQLLYHDVLLHKCYENPENMEIPLASFNPRMISSNLFAYFLVNTRGYMIVTIDEIAHTLKCYFYVPILITLTKTKYCYNELSISDRNSNFFLTPITRMLISDGTKIDCNPEMPGKFSIDNKWYEPTIGNKWYRPFINNMWCRYPDQNATSISDLAMIFFYNANVIMLYILYTFFYIHYVMIYMILIMIFFIINVTATTLSYIPYAMIFFYNATVTLCHIIIIGILVFDNLFRVENFRFL